MKNTLYLEICTSVCYYVLCKGRRKMKKVVCNVVYLVRVPAWYDDKGISMHDVGTFESKQDAYVAGELYVYALRHAQVRNLPKKVYRASMEEVLIPEGKPTGCYKDLDEFFIANRHVRDLSRFYDKSFVDNLVATANNNYKQFAEEEQEEQ